MASLSPHIWQGCNLFCGDHDPTASMHLVLESLKLPVFEEMMQDHHGGGAPFKMKFGVGYEALEASFKTKGAQPEVMSAFGLGSELRRTFTAYQAYQDKRSGRYIENKAIMVARLVKIEADEGKRGELQGHDHGIDELWRYEVYYDGKEKYFWSADTNEWRVDGIPQWKAINSILRIS